MQTRNSVAVSLGAGAALMYLLDPERGTRRRALLRDKLVRGARLIREAASATGRDLRNRTYGSVAHLRSAFSAEALSDDRLVARVRSTLGRVVSHPHAIEVSADNGVISLRGPILQSEAAALLQGIDRIRGVREVISNLDEHKHAGNVAALQGGTRRPGLHADLFQDQWSPTTRLLAASAAATLMGYCARRRDATGFVVGTLGFLVFARGLANVDIARLSGMSSPRRSVDVHKTITLDAAVDEVFQFWTAYENFPRFMSHVLDVRPGALEGQSHWTVAGPAGVPVKFSAEITRLIPNQVLAWKTIEGATVAHAGVIDFEPTSDGKTRVNIRMTYNPPAGWLGHGMATAFAVDPKSSMDADLVRMKTLIETGRIPRDAAQNV